MKGNNARDKVIKEKQIELTLKYRAQSFSFREIAERVSQETGVKITHVTAFNDYIDALNEAKKQVEETALYSLVSQLEKLDTLEHQYWRAWDKSIANSKTKSAKKKGKQSKQEDAAVELEEKEVEQNGEVAFLNGIKSCIELRCKMMGYITSNLDITSGGKALSAITGLVVK